MEVPVSEAIEQTRAPDRRRTRRKFLQAVAVGGAALVAGPALAARPAAAQRCQPPPNDEFCNGAVEVEVGRITLGAMLNLYLAAPLSARGQLEYSVERSRTETFTMTTETNRELTVAPSLGLAGSWGPTGNRDTIEVTGGFSRNQARSSKVSRAITHATTESQSISTVPVPGGGHNTWDHTAFLMMARPVFSIRVPMVARRPDGTPIFGFQRYFRLRHGGILFPRSARELRDDPGTRNFIGAETADNILAHYPLRPDKTDSSGLTGPRFGPPTAISPGEVPLTFSRSMTSSSTLTTEAAEATTTEITAGFTLDLGIVEIGFETGRKMTTTRTVAQEFGNEEIISFSGTLSSDLNHLNHIIEDRVWATLLVTDQGPLPAAFDAVSGRVTAVDGTPIGGAVLTMPVDGITHETVTDQDGNYTFRLAGNVQPGAYRVTCAGVTRTVTIDPGETARANYPRVSSGRARERPS
jgi:Carboxypeptidase regulatory-like domain